MRALVLAVLVTLVGCTLNTDYFSEYRGKNLLSNYGFEALESDGTTPKWALEPLNIGSANITSGVNATDFMNWTDVSADATLAVGYQHGPDGASPAYRLEIKNLVTNGDFEGVSTPAGTTSLQAPWSAFSGTGATAYSSGRTQDAGGGALGGSYGLDGVSMWWYYGNLGNYLTLDLTSMLTTWPLVKTNYRLRMEYLTVAVTPLPTFKVNSTQLPPITTAALTRTSLLADISVPTTTATEVFQIGDSQATTNVSIDNVRMVPDIGTLWVRTALPSIDSGSLRLLPGSKTGMYVLTLQVRDDPTAGTANRFNPSAVTVRVVAKVKSGTSNPSPTVFARPSGGWSSWTTLTMNFGFDFVTDDADQSRNALTIEISPTDTATAAGIDTGSVLIAQPKLTFNP